ncbi:hypothetical protein BGZ54_004599 [Gamsiella multidivaricata]|nr:hypothetical protein BGZ54_004599 [Gamsiella multidivaricata]
MSPADIAGSAVVDTSTANSPANVMTPIPQTAPDSHSEAVPTTSATNANANATATTGTTAVIAAPASAAAAADGTPEPSTQAIDASASPPKGQGTPAGANSRTPAPPGEKTSSTTDKPVPTDLESAHREKGPDTEAAVDNSAALVDDTVEIASDIQERSQLSDIDRDSLADQDESDFAHDTATEALRPGEAQGAAPTISTAFPATVSPGKVNKNDETNNRDIEDITAANSTNPLATEAPVSTSIARNSTSAIGAKSANDKPASELPVSEKETPDEDSASAPAASYTSPNHEWARILQKRLGKGLNDAQLLARSNSMLASPSILAQSLIQVIPSLQVKESSAVSPGATGREYQTAEELFDRPATIEPSGPAFHYDSHFSRDEVFPSSALANNSQAPLLLFAPLNPEQLLGKSSNSSKSKAPPPLADNPSPAKQPQPQPQPQPDHQSALAPLTSQQQQQSTPLSGVIAPPPPPSIPIPVPPIAGASSPASKIRVVSPTPIESRNSPLISRDQGIGLRNVRQSFVLHPTGQEERPGLISHGTSASRTLLGQGSSSSLTTTPAASAPNATGTSNYPIAPIQYTPVTQYKANPSKESSKMNRKTRDTITAAKDATVLVESPKDLKAVAENKEPVVATAIEPAQVITPSSVVPVSAASAPATATAAPTSTGAEITSAELITDLKSTSDPAVDATAQWALDALSGFSDVNFDATLPVSVAVATTLATTSYSKDLPSKLPMMLPLSSAGSKSNQSATESSPAKIIQSPFESAQTASEEMRQRQQTATPELRSQPLQASTSVDPYHNLVATISPSTSTAFAPSSYPGTHPLAAHSSYVPFDQSTNNKGYHHGGHGAHQANRSISSLRDLHIHNTPVSVERPSHDLGHLRRGELMASVDSTHVSTTHSTSSLAPPALSLGSGYQIPWLPQSRPVLPPKADINSIDVPALTGNQLLPSEPRRLNLDSTDPCLQFKHIGEALRHWGQHTPEGNSFANLDGKGVECGSWDWSFTLGRAEMIAKAIHDKTQLRAGARVALVFRLSEILEFIAAFYGAILAGVVPVLVNQIQDFSEMVYIMTSAKVELALTTQFNHKSLQKDLKKGAVWPSGVVWWQTDILETWAPKSSQQERLPLANNELAYIEYTKSALGELKGVAVSHKNLIMQCQALFASMLWRPALYRDKNGNLQPDPLLESDTPAPHPKESKKNLAAKRAPGTAMTWLEPRQQSGLILGCIMGVFCGSFTVFMESAITAVSGLWAHSVAAYRANVAFADYIGVQKLLRNFRINPQATITPTRPDLRFLRTVYVDTQTNNPVLNREFLDDYLYPLGVLPRQDLSSKGSQVVTMEGALPSSASGSNSKMVRSDLGVIAFLSLQEHGGMIVCLRDPLDPPANTQLVDLRKHYRKSTLPRPRRPSAAVQDSDVSTEHHPQPSAPEKTPKNDPSSAHSQGGLLNHPPSSLTCSEYLLHRTALRSNRIVILATGDEAYKRRDEPGAVLLGAFGYPLVQSTVFVVDPETLALSLPDVVGEIWVSSPGMPIGFWGLPEHSQEVFNAKCYIITEENMIPTVYRPPGCEKLLRTGLLGAMIEGRVVVFGSYWDRLQQDTADPMKPIGVQYEYHHSSELKKTLFAKVGGIGEISIFECFVNKEYLPVVCIELSRDSRWNGQSTNTVALHIATNARHILKEVNALRSYCVAVWDVNTLPRIFENGRRVVDHALCKKMFELGRIYRMLYFGTFTEDVMFNIPRGDDIVNGFWSRECVAKRQRRQGTSLRYVQYTSSIVNPDAYDEKTNVFMGKFHNITDVLIWRSIIQPDDAAFIELDSRVKEQRLIPFKKFNQKVTGYAMHLEKKHGLKAGDHVLLWFTQDLDYIITLHACWVLGLVPIPLPLPDSAQTNHSQPSHFIGSHGGSGSMIGHLGAAVNASSAAGANTPNGANSTNLALSSKAVEDKRNGILRALLRIMDEVKVKAILGNNTTDEYLKQKTTGAYLRTCRSAFTATYSQTPEMFASADIVLPTFCNVSKAAKTKQMLGALSGYAPRKEWFAANYPAVYLIDTESKAESITSKKLLKLNHETLNNLCRNQKLQFKTLTGQPVVTSMSIFHGLGFIHGCLCGIYNGGPTVIIQPTDFLANPIVLLEAVSRYKAQDVALTYPMLDQLLSRLDGTHGASSAPGSVNLESIVNFMLCGHGRVQREKTMTAIGRLGPLKLAPEAINLIYSHPLNPMVTSQMERDAGSIRIHVSSKNLRYGIITPTSEGDDPTGIWLEDVGVTTICTSIAIVHPETHEVCAANQIGEIWICSDASINSFHVPTGFTSNPTHPQPFNACITGYDSRVKYVRTGDLGFLWNGQQQQLLMRQHSLSQQGQWPGAQTNMGSGSFQLFVLGRLEDSFQFQGLLHFAVDIEATVESSHANVAAQGCVAFKTAQGQVVCVVKVQNQEPELLVSMYIPIMHAILEQHQFLPDSIILVGDNVSTAKRITDGLKPRETISSLHNSDRLPILHRHHCHGQTLAPVPSSMLPPIIDRPLSELPIGTSSAFVRSSYSYPQHQQPSAASAANASSSRFQTGVSSASMNAAGRGPPHVHLPAFNNGSPVEAGSANHGTSRNSIYGSPLLSASIPLPPGAHNPLQQSPATNNISLNGPTTYQPHTHYHPGGGYLSSSPAAVLPGSAVVNPPVLQQQQPPISTSSLGSNHSASNTNNANGSGLTNNNNKNNSSSSLHISTLNLLSEMAMYTGGSASPVNERPSRTAQNRNTQQPPLLQQHSQPQLLHHSQGQSRASHSRQAQSQDAISLSSEELKVGPPDSKQGGGVKGIMKGMNAKWSEIRKAGMT